MGLIKKWAIRIILLAGLMALAGALLLPFRMEATRMTYQALRVWIDEGHWLSRVLWVEDTPPLFLWLTGSSMEMFGASPFTYRLPTFILIIGGLIATYKLGHLLYNKRIGFIASLILFTSQALFLMVEDPRSQGMTMSLVVLSVWQIMEFIYYNRKRNLVWGAFLMGLGTLSGGWIGLGIPTIALLSYFVGRNDWQQLTRPAWIVGLLLAAMVSSPYIMASISQHQHPEKAIHLVNTTIPKGSIELHLTFDNGTVIDLDTSDQEWVVSAIPHYFGSFLWSFIPWSILGLWALLWRFTNTIEDLVRGRQKQEWLTLGGFFLPLLYYILRDDPWSRNLFVVYPFVAVATSEFALRVIFEKPKWWRTLVFSVQLLSQWVIILVILATLIFLVPPPWYIWVIWSGLVILAITQYFSGEGVHQVLVSSFLVALAFHLVLNFHLFSESKNEDDLKGDLEAHVSPSENVSYETTFDPFLPSSDHIGLLPEQVP